MRRFVTRAAGIATVGALALAPASAAPGPSGEPGTGTLTIRVKGLKNDKGQVGVALFASAASFPRSERAFRGQTARIEGGRAVVHFGPLDPGTYAVAVLHDENENGKMDFNFLGMPLEGYGFSNDASALFGPPSFEKAAFRLLARSSALTINARYLL